jgi:hypothetical protein
MEGGSCFVRYFCLHSYIVFRYQWWGFAVAAGRAAGTACPLIGHMITSLIHHDPPTVVRQVLDTDSEVLKP